MRKQLVCGIILAGLLAACGTPSPTLTDTALPAATLVASNTPFVRKTLPPIFTATPGPEGTLTTTPVLVDPLMGVRVPPPLTMALPADWEVAYDTFLYEELGDTITVPFALYQGPVTGGTGTIVLLWNYRRILMTGTPSAAADWSDGLRLLRYPVFEPTCNIGTDPQRDFTVGGLPAAGTNFRVVDCPELPDTKGWFASLIVNDIGYIFYLYTDPIEAMKDTVPFELQAILDSVRFTANE